MAETGALAHIGANPGAHRRAARVIVLHTGRDFAFCAHDDWKVSPKLTLNYGLRYDPTTNPVEAHNELYAITNFATATGFTNVPHAFEADPSLHNFDPRVGFAYDLFAKLLEHRSLPNTLALRTLGACNKHQ